MAESNLSLSTILGGSAITALWCGQLLTIAVAAYAGEPAALGERELVPELQRGGYVLFLRHFQTDPDQADTDPLHLENTAAQRQLSDAGRKQAVAVGESIRALKIPVDRLIASKFFRAYESAKLLGVGNIAQSVDVTEGGLVVSPRENQRRAKALRELLSEPPSEGTNTVIVSHRPNLQDAAGLRFGDVGEGEAVVFKPLGGGEFEAVARVPWDKWNALVR